jgi:pimeloyl-ACP methyl ester carboxylesterase
MPTIDLPGGPLDVIDTGGPDPAVVLVHGLMMDGHVWREVTDDLRADHRVVAPTLPLGAHRTPMRAGADLSMTGLADLLAGVLAWLDADDVTLVANDWGGPLVTAVRHPHLVDRLVLTPCEAFDNLPPGLPGRMAGLSARLPGGLFLAAQGLRFPVVQRLPLTLGPMAAGGLPQDLVRQWLRPLRTQPAVRRDLRAYVRTTRGDELEAIVDDLAALDVPTLVAWTTDGRMMPAEHGPRLAELMAHGHYAEIADATVLVQLDQPTVVARLIRRFVADHPLEAAGGRAADPAPARAGGSEPVHP